MSIGKRPSFLFSYLKVLAIGLCGAALYAVLAMHGYASSVLLLLISFIAAATALYRFSGGTSSIAPGIAKRDADYVVVIQLDNASEGFTTSAGFKSVEATEVRGEQEIALAFLEHRALSSQQRLVQFGDLACV